MENLLLYLLFIAFMTNSIQGCHYYRDDEDEDRRRKRSLVYDTDETIFLRIYFTDCMTAKIDDPSYDWRSNVDFTVLDSLWHLNTLQIYCSPSAGGPTVDCWKREITNYLKASTDILQAAQECISDFAQDAGQDPPINRYRSQESRKKRSVVTEAATKTFSLDLPALSNFTNLPQFNSCLSNTIAFRDVRSPLNYNSLSIFIEKNTINLCDANTLATNFVTSPPWPYRFLALTRTDTVLRPSLENCVLQVFPPDSFWSSWGGWSACSKTCGTGVQSQRRTCRSGQNPREEANSCSGKTKKLRRCQLKACDYYVWGKWRKYGLCSKSCGGGQQFSTRPCLKNGYIPVQIINCIPYGRARHFRQCNNHPCYHYSRW